MTCLPTDRGPFSGRRQEMDHSRQRAVAGRWFSRMLAYPIVVASACAQPVIDQETYKAAKAAATATFLDNSKPTKERLAAVSGMGYPEATTMQRLLGVAQDKAEDSAV